MIYIIYIDIKGFIQDFCYRERIDHVKYNTLGICSPMEFYKFRPSEVAFGGWGPRRLVADMLGRRDIPYI